MRLLLLATVLAACSGDPARYVEAAHAAHAQADALLRSGDLAGATGALEDFAARPVPSAIAAHDRRVVLQDTYARMAAIALQHGDAVRALKAAEAGLALGKDRDVFTSSLLTLRGRAREALGHDAEAARDYEAAQRVAEALLDELLADGGTR
jgi:hypothetical protein